MNIKKLGIIGITLLSMIFLNACKGDSGDSFSATVVDDIIESATESEVKESVFEENISTEEKTESVETTIIKPEEILSDVVIFTEESLTNVEDDNTDSNTEWDDSKNNNTLDELADVPEGF